MKVGIQQPVLLESLKKGAIPALSEDAQSDFSNMAILMQSVKITAADGSFMIEAQNGMSSNRFSIKASKENGVVIKEDGACLIKAKDFYNWVHIQGSESVVNLTLDKLATPETVNATDDESFDDKFAIRRIGVLKVLAKDNNKTGNKWEIDAYDPDHLKCPSYSSKGKKQLSMNAEDFMNAVRKVSFAILKRDDNHILDSVSIQNQNDKCYFVGTDKAQCASYNPEDVGDFGVDANEPLLISLQVLETNLKVVDKHKRLELYYNSSNNKVFLSQENFDVRISIVDKDTRDKFASISVLISKTYDELAEMNRKSLIKVMSSAGLVNKRSVLADFKKDEKILTVQALTTFGKRPSVSRAEAIKISKDVDIVCGSGDISHALKNFKDDVVILEYSNRVMRITSNEDVGFVYYSILFNDNIYNDLRKGN